jgi:cephalosporin hydroxylase
MTPAEEKKLIEDFHRLWYGKGQFQMSVEGEEAKVVVQLDAKYCGFLVQKNPLDLWVYQEIIWECQPDLIIEMGTASGGSALFMANVLDLVGKGEIVSVDIDNRLGIVPKHPRILHLVGDSVSAEIFSVILSRVKKWVYAGGNSKLYAPKVMVILDDDHTTQHVLQELDMYHQVVTPGQYLIVEDTNVDWPLGGGDGPGLAVHLFLKTHPEFVPDIHREKFLMTWNPGGYLKRS